MEDYVVRFGNDKGYVERSDYMSREQAEKFYNKIELDIKTTWKELLYEPLEKEDVQEIIKSDNVKIVDLGICRLHFQYKKYEQISIKWVDRNKTLRYNKDS